jgi:hypothetical protein
VVGQLEPNAAVDIIEVATLAVWFQIQGTGEHEEHSGWVPSHYDSNLRRWRNRAYPARQCRRIHDGYLQRMLNDRFFLPAFSTTLLLMVLILPGAVCPGNHHGAGDPGALERQ